MLLHPMPGDMFDDIEFKWLKPRSVHYAAGRFLDKKGRPSGELFELIVSSKGDYEGGEEYSPLHETASLGSDFAKLAPEKDQIAAFASKWGFLTRPDAARTNEQRRKKRPEFGEAIVTWDRSIRDYQQAIAVLEWLRDGKERELEKRIVQEPESALWRFSSDDGRNILRFSIASPTNARTIFVLGGRVLAAYVNFHLMDHSYPSLLPTSRIGQEEHFVLRIRPKNLIGLLWWQLARKALGDVNYRLCKVCKSPLEISKDDTGFRTNREFCSDVCKQKDYREKVKTAKKMHAEGLKIQLIAKHFGTTPNIIQNWVTKKN